MIILFVVATVLGLAALVYLVGALVFPDRF